MGCNNRHRTVRSIEEITVYPEFVSFYRKESLFSLAPVIEDDDGSVCFVSQEEKDRYLGASDGK